MILFGLEKLYYDMKNKNQESCKFEYKVRDGVTFDIFYSIGHAPNELLFGLKQSENLAFLVKVRKGWKIDPILDSKTYYSLIEILFEGKKSENPFKPSDFFREFSSKIPKTAGVYKYREKAQYQKFRTDIDKADKIYFYGFKRNPVGGNGASKENIKKTADAFGSDIASFCFENKISSCWTAYIELSKDHKRKEVEDINPYDEINRLNKNT